MINELLMQKYTLKSYNYDMSAHIKASLIGSSVTIPIKNHKLNLGTWQGIYLCEFRDGGDSRKLSISIL